MRKSRKERGEICNEMEREIRRDTDHTDLDIKM